MQPHKKEKWKQTKKYVGIQYFGNYDLKDLPKCSETNTNEIPWNSEINM